MSTPSSPSPGCRRRMRSGPYRRLAPSLTPASVAWLTPLGHGRHPHTLHEGVPATMMTGEEYKASLFDGRATFFEGKRVDDIPATRTWARRPSRSPTTTTGWRPRSRRHLADHRRADLAGGAAGEGRPRPHGRDDGPRHVHVDHDAGHGAGEARPTPRRSTSSASTATSRSPRRRTSASPSASPTPRVTAPGRRRARTTPTPTSTSSTAAPRASSSAAPSCTSPPPRSATT